MEILHTIGTNNRFTILFFKIIGAIVIIISGIRGAINLFNKEPRTKLYLPRLNSKLR